MFDVKSQEGMCDYEVIRNSLKYFFSEWKVPMKKLFSELSSMFVAFLCNILINNNCIIAHACMFSPYNLHLCSLTVIYGLHRRITADGWSHNIDVTFWQNLQRDLNSSPNCWFFFINVKGWICIPEEALNNSITVVTISNPISLFVIIITNLVITVRSKD